MANYIRLWTQKITSISVVRCQIFGIIWLVLGILSTIWTPYQMIMDERIRMRPGLPGYEWWLEPPPMFTKFYIYNITNADRFLKGIDSKLIVEELAPVVYKEFWKHENVTFNGNGTMSYVIRKSLKYLDEGNRLHLNATIVVPNLAVLLTASYFWNASIFTKIGLNYLFNTFDARPIITTTIYNLLHNNTDQFVNAVNDWAPYMLPVKDLSLMNLMYRDGKDVATAFMGTESGHQLFSLIEKYAGSTNVPGHEDSCKYKVTNSSEGYTYNQLITQGSVLRYYQRNLCKVIHLYFDGEDSVYGLSAYKFAMTNTELDRIYPIEDDCFDSTPSLPNGISDISKCFFSFPLVASYIYFENTDSDLDIFPEIRAPKGKVAPKSFTSVHPATGLPLKSSAALQGNLYIRDLSGFKRELQKFSNTILPYFWIHYTNDEMPLKIICAMYLVDILPYTDCVATTVFFLSGIYCIWKSFRRKSYGRGEKHKFTVRSEKRKFEAGEAFEELTGGNDVF